MIAKRNLSMRASGTVSRSSGRPWSQRLRAARRDVLARDVAAGAADQRALEPVRREAVGREVEDAVALDDRQQLLEVGDAGVGPDRRGAQREERGARRADHEQRREGRDGDARASRCAAAASSSAADGEEHDQRRRDRERLRLDVDAALPPRQHVDEPRRRPAPPAPPGHGGATTTRPRSPARRARRGCATIASGSPLSSTRKSPSRPQAQ